MIVSITVIIIVINHIHTHNHFHHHYQFHTLIDSSWWDTTKLIKTTEFCGNIEINVEFKYEMPEDMLKLLEFVVKY